MSAPKPRIALVDGSGYIFRAYHALPPLTRKDGTPVGAVYGFTNMLLKLQQKLQVDYLAVIFDAARDTFRNEIYADYKANRDETPEDLKPQFAIVREATDAMNIPRIELDRYEADDIIASYARQLGGDNEVMIVSSDKDLMQLITDDVYMYDPMKNRELRAEAVMEKFGVAPDKVIEVQALIGDSVDNVPGVPGIGPKTAALLVDEFGSLEGVLAGAGSIKQNTRRESLIEHTDAARLSYELVKLKDDLALPLSLEELAVRGADSEALLAFLQQNNFTSLLKKKEAEFGVSAPQADVAPASGEAWTDGDYSLVTDMDALQQWIADACAAGHIAIDTETTSVNAMRAELVGISLCIEAGKACYIPLSHVAEHAAQSAGQGSLFGGDEGGETEWRRVDGQLDRDAVLGALQPLLSDPAVLKIGQNIKYDMLVLKKYGVEIAPIDDSMLLSYVTAAGLHAHNMDELSQLHLGHKPIAFKEVVGTGKAQKLFSQIALDAARDYAAEDADITLRLSQRLKGQLVADKLTTIYETIERPLVPVIVQMEANGIKVAPEKLREMSLEFEGKLATLEKEIHGLAGREFNVGSPKQLGEILFDEMSIEGGKKGKTGAYATGAEILEELSLGGHVIAEKVLTWRQLSKLKSTYTDALPREIHPQTGRVHTSFSMAATTTGRLSSSEPNLQNIPIRTEEGRRIREAFVADAGHKLISADYSQIELRLLAHIADMDVLKQAFKDGRDIHATTASQMFGVPLDAVDSELRRKAKTINFGIIYGISAHGLAQRLGIGRPEAAEYINAYFEQYPGIKAYMERTKEEARANGYVTTLFGRRVYVKDIAAKNPNLRAFSERAAINAPLQGTAADIIKRAMVSVYDALAAQFPEARLLLQVHDELIVEAPEAQAEAVAALIKTQMSAAAHLSVPLLVEAGIGDHWGEIH
jgi:DNA polymerase-1